MSDKRKVKMSEQMDAGKAEVGNGAGGVDKLKCFVPLIETS